MSKHTILIRPDGSVSFLHDDTLTSVLKPEGDIFIERASDVSYDNANNGWCIYKPGTRDKLFDGLFSTRNEALVAEKNFLEKRL